MASIIAQILMVLNMLLGAGDHSAKANEIYRDGAYTICDGVIIIDENELM
ncbi:MAG: hypothetical protein RMK52_00080 [Chitinophagales bacterium]|nr:hypothetical protein [Chitinophagales bacterium]MDW8392624.1 hypothetical protein [Chitinophagales bacterium]MDW8428606.1 hypothetical protein [Chitinophagales bacterium]